MKTIHVNLYAASGFGKSAIAEETSALLRRTNHSVELVREYAKELHWQGKLWGTEQFVLTAEQFRRQAELDGMVDIVITDSALPLGLLHAPAEYRAALETIVKAVTAKWSQEHVLLERDIESGYSTVGRDEKVAEARQHQGRVRQMVRDWTKDHYLTMHVTNATATTLAQHVASWARAAKAGQPIA